MKRYDIEPNGDAGGHGHKFYRVEREIEDVLHKLSKRSYVEEDGDPLQSKGDTFTAVNEAAKSAKLYDTINVEKQYKPYLGTEDTRYIEMLVSADDKMFNHYNDTGIIIERVLNAIGQVDQAYQAINIRLVVVAMEIQTNGPAHTRYLDSPLDLMSFKKHYLELKSGALKDIRIDNAQLFSHHSWRSNVGGLAYLGRVCTDSSVAINTWSYTSMTVNTHTLGHEFGHNLGFDHDDPKRCKCLSPRGCFMGGHKGTRPGFSDCSLNALKPRVYGCIHDYPINPITSQCGNGIKEKDEECDCGTIENCLKNDPCCEPGGCKLKKEAQCSVANDDSCCNRTSCQFKRQGILCREAASNCDVPEFCSGDAGFCPDDQGILDGMPCGESKKLLHGFSDASKETTSEIMPRVTAQYFKIIPKHWKKNGVPCMRAEMYGCLPREDSASVPTSIVLPRLYYTKELCLTPDVTSCDDVTDGTKIVYQKAINNKCDLPHMMFITEPNGTLIHHCSKKRVCPDYSSGLDMIISSKCRIEESQYIRTEEWALKHKRTGFCVVTKSGFPVSGKNARLISTCKSKHGQTKLIMRNVDCYNPLGFQSGDLPVSAFSSSPHLSDSINNIRLGGKKIWCSASDKSSSWFKVDFGHRVEVRYVTIGGQHRLGFVSSYHLMYSDDGKTWTYYKESNPSGLGMNSHCYKGVCAPTYDHQCQQIWGAYAKSASDSCWNYLNTGTDGFGTCSATEILPCARSDVKCGQLQCNSPAKIPYYEKDLGKNYSSIIIKDKRCSKAIIVGSNDEVGLGMVAEGTRCSDGMVCIEQKCVMMSEHIKGVCHMVDGTVCNGKGICLHNGKCFCDSGYDPESNCSTLTIPVDGGWGTWSSWSACSKVCDSGTQKRYRFCNNPTAKHGGKDCVGEQVEEENCNTEPCIVGKTCKDIKKKMKNKGVEAADGIYEIKPKGELSLKVYCDMTRDGGGWTLIVSSHTNTWNARLVRLRNIKSPDLYADYSILQLANILKENVLIKDTMFQYRIEAHSPGKWGGIWKAPVAYDMASTNSNLRGVTLLEKFSDWEYDSNGLENRLPYINNQRLTIGSPQSGWGCLTDNNKKYHPSRWINGDLKMNYPDHIWYWFREGDYENPKSCLELMFGGFASTRLASGIYEIEPEKGKPVQTFCDFDRHGGGWTLVVNSSAKGGWTSSNVNKRNSDNVEAMEYSIFKTLPALRGKDPGEESYDYMIEAGGPDQHGGIFALSKIVAKRSSTSLKPTVIKKFGSWIEDMENIAKYPIQISNGVIGSFNPQTNLRSSGMSGVLISDNGKDSYMTTYKKPSSIKLWVRAGGSRMSCNDLRTHGHINGKDDYKDGFYMMNHSLPMYCDMTTTDNEGWTLLVTSASKGWSKKEVKSRNEQYPSLEHNYSILGRADSIKSLSKGTHFKYMLTAQNHRHWGGIWKAPSLYSFTGTRKDLTNVELIKQFDKWQYDTEWWRGPAKRMPYLESRPDKNQALLTTAFDAASYEWGSIVSNNSHNSPSKWIYPEMGNPGLIWYWMNENSD